MSNEDHLKLFDGEPYADSVAVVAILRNVIATGTGNVTLAREWLPIFVRLAWLGERLQGCKVEGRGDDDPYVQELTAEKKAILARPPFVKQKEHEP